MNQTFPLIMQFSMIRAVPHCVSSLFAYTNKYQVIYTILFLFSKVKDDVYVCVIFSCPLLKKVRSSLKYEKIVQALLTIVGDDDTIVKITTMTEIESRMK